MMAEKYLVNVDDDDEVVVTVLKYEGRGFYREIWHGTPSDVVESLVSSGELKKQDAKVVAEYERMGR